MAPAVLHGVLYPWVFSLLGVCVAQGAGCVGPGEVPPSSPSTGEAPADTEKPVDTGLDEEAPESSVFVAISGGGFHSHTTMSGWISGLLRNEETGIEDLDTLWAPVRGISSNSGGSWFLVHLACSGAFEDALLEDARSAEGTWAQSGYLADMTATYFSFMDEGSDPSILPDYLASYLNLFPAGNRRWYSFVEEAVYGPLGTGEEVGGIALADSDQRLSWARDKDLLVAAAIVAKRTVLREKDANWFSYNQYVSALPVGQTALSAHFVPVLFAGPAPDRQAAPLFPAGDQSLLYFDNYTDSPISVTLSADFEDEVDALGATAVSSAAFAMLASETVLRDILGLGANLAANVAWLEADLAPPAWFTDAGLRVEDTIPDENLGFWDFAEQRVVRLADGGFVDNTAVAVQLRQMQDNGDLVDGFQLGAFMNASYEGVSFHGETINVGIATLFGHSGGPDELDAPGDGLVWQNPFGDAYLKTPSPQVFEETPWSEGHVDFTRFDLEDPALSEGGTVTVQTMEIPVTTVENEVYGIPAGVTGTLRVLEVRQLGSSAMPLESSEFDRYESLFHLLRDEAIADDEIRGFLLEVLGHA